ncbi:HEAT repeat domain-containing protein [Akkermansiaceae bacterium]|nr:HEAT repeat domain-containing protein [Akkermansiaceae bacterium]
MRNLLLLVFLALPATATATDLIFDTFESDGFGEWLVKGDAFGKAPTAVTPQGVNGKITGYSGQYFVSSGHGGDKPTGSLTSPQFKISQPFLGFMIAGGGHKGKTAVQLLIGDKITFEATGQNDLEMKKVVWPLEDHKGKQARIRIIDTEPGSWGIINADHFVFSDNQKPFFPKPKYRESKANKDGLIASGILPGLTIPEGAVAKLFATNKTLGVFSPTALTVDEKGRVFLAETHRFRFGVEDNRSHLYWLMDDISAQTTDDRIAMHEKWQEKLPLEKLTTVSEKIRVLIDTDGDGVADKSEIFAEKFNDLLDGTAAGIMAFEGKIYFACIPNIWMIEDEDGDLKSDKRRVLQDGFGVRVSFSGHDLNGFALGPDGRLYTTIGDRGFSFTTKEGHEYKYPNQGAILRFEPDGSNMEVVHTGLRNPKEIAFDQFGTGITVDNNSDQGDRARVVFMLEGADSGWRMGHQVLHSFHKTAGIPNRPINQWMQEKMWEPKNDSQPGHIVPPMLNLTSGPSGLAYYPGTGFSLGCKDQFLICDYRGGAAASGIWKFSIKDDGAGFAVDNSGKFNWGVAATDIEWGYDGKLYVSDFVSGWQSHNAGRVYTLEEQNPGKTAAEFLAKFDFANATPRSLSGLLSHADQRIRLRAQLQLASLPEGLPILTAASNQKINYLERLHGIWGLGIMARKGNTMAANILVRQLPSDDPRIRAQVTQALGEAPLKTADILIPVLTDGSPRVRALAAIAVGRIGDSTALPSILEMIKFNGNNDPVLRHAGVMALVGIATEQEIADLIRHESEAVRHAAVISLRRMGSPKVISFLGDTSLKVSNDVIRAIHDTQIEMARPVLAALLDDQSIGAPQRPVSRMILRRLIHTAYRIPNEQNLLRVIKAAVNPLFPIEERKEAMRLLSIWENPPVVDQSLGYHSPLSPRDPAIMEKVLGKHISILLDGGQDIFGDAMKLALKYGIQHEGLDSGSLTRIIRDDQTDGKTRAGALDLFLKSNPENADEILNEAARSKNEELAARALQLGSERNPTSTVAALKGALKSDSISLRQMAWGIIGELPSEHAVPLIREGLLDLRDGKGNRSTGLDLLIAAEKREEQSIKSALNDYRTSLPEDDPLAIWQTSLAGGNASRGFKVFQTHAAAQCMRCHRHEPGHSEGGEAGPNLMGAALRHDANGLLESLILPHAEIADGFGVAEVKLKNGTSKSGTIAARTDEYLDLKESESAIWRIKLSDLAEKPRPVSAMPAMGQILNPYETRDLIAWLLTLTKPNSQKPPPYEAKELSLADSKKMDEETKRTEAPARLKTQTDQTVSENNEIDPAVMELGKAQYNLCLGCHGPTGQGMPNVGPPLAKSEWVAGPVENLIGIQLRGLQGAITVNDVDYQFAAPMVAMGAGQPDENIAAVLTYVRNSFGNSASAVTPEMVAQYKDNNKDILSKVPPPMLNVKDLIDPFTKPIGVDGTPVISDAPAPAIPEIPSNGLGVSTTGMIIFLLIAGLTGIGLLRMKTINKEG